MILISPDKIKGISIATMLSSFNNEKEIIETRVDKHEFEREICIIYCSVVLMRKFIHYNYLTIKFLIFQFLMLRFKW